MTEYKYKANPSYYYTIKQGNSAIAFDSERDYYTRSSDDYITLDGMLMLYNLHSY